MQCFLFTQRPRHKEISLGKSVTFYVPVSGGGRGTIKVGNKVTFGYPLSHRLGNGEITLQPRAPEAEIIIGHNIYINNNTVLCALQSIRIGDDCLIGDMVAIVDADFHELSPATRTRSPGIVKPVTIGRNVWIGSRSMILKGVSIGDNSVIGAMSLVTKSIPPNSLVAGNPAKVIRNIE